MKKRRRLKLKVRMMLTFIVAIVLFGYVSFSIINYSVSKKKFENEERILETKLYELKDEETDLNQEISKLKDDDYLARYAREEYLYSKDGEYVIKIEEKSENKPNEEIEMVGIPKYLTLLNILIAGAIVGTLIAFILKAKKHQKLEQKINLVS